MTSTIENPTITTGSRVRRLGYPAIYTATVLHVDDEGQAYLVWKAAAVSEWGFLKTAVSTLEIDTDPDVPGATLVEIGRVLAHREQLIQAVATERTTELNNLRGALDDYKEQVREVALEFKAQENWCDEGFNEAMDRLGLPRINRQWRVPVTLRATQTVYMTVSANDEADAIDVANQEADSTDLWNRASSYDWEYDDYDVTDSTYDVDEDDE